MADFFRSWLVGSAALGASLALLGACSVDSVTLKKSQVAAVDAGEDEEPGREPFESPLNPDNDPWVGDAGADGRPGTPASSSVGEAGRAGEGTPGDIVISEVMYDPSLGEPTNEWFEIHNPTSAVRSLTGLTIVDGSSRTHVISGVVNVPPGGWVVLARNTAAAVASGVPAPAIVYEYGAGIAESSGILLANGSNGKITLTSGDAVIASAPYGGGFDIAAGRSVQLFALGQSQLLASWCLSQNPWATGADRGTPGRPPDCK